MSLNTLQANKSLNNDIPDHFYRDSTSINWHQQSRRKAIMAMLADKENQRVLDYGCGFGDISFEISKRNHVNGVDIDEARVKFAQQQYPEIKFSVCTKDTLKFADDSFDIVVSVVVINFISSPEQYLSEIKRVLVKGGMLVIAVKNDEWHSNEIRKYLGRAKSTEKNTVANQGYFQQLLNDFGFEIKEIGFFHDHPIEEYRNRKKIYDFLHTALGWLCFYLGKKESSPYFVYKTIFKS